jgi:hypothetical protein
MLRNALESLKAAFLSKPADAPAPSRRADLLDRREPWTEAACTYLSALDDHQHSAWANLLGHARSATQTRPTKKWLSEAGRILDAVGRDQFAARVSEWFPIVRALPSSNVPTYQKQWPLIERNTEALKGLVWFCSLVEDESVTRAVSVLGQACYKRLPGFGPLSAKAGNACLYSLGALPGLAAVAQLSRLRLKVKYAQALRLIDRALQEAATRLGMSRDDLDEIAVPTFGLDDSAALAEEFGEYTALVRVLGTHEVEGTWKRADGRPQKSAPASIKETAAEELKELKRTIKDIETMLPAQRDRMERLLLSGREWALDAWRERYLAHPLLGVLARRLIWHFHCGERTGLGIWHEGGLVAVDGQPMDWLTPESIVRLWHPIGFDPQIVLSWRRWLEEHEVTQPFKQAHREIYIITDAELSTGTYSNRFAAHILRQHQFAALARQRGWKYSLQGQFDSHNTPTLELPAANLLVEFWVDALNNDDQTSEMGIYLHLSTDQVRFCRPGIGPLQLTDVPAHIFSELMRDVDLFVGVCSVGNDPAWHDRGELGGLGGYWQNYAFGDLSATARTRKETLERLLPRLKIADRCLIIERFLTVRGRLRTYKIHLGSGNILMEPNDQYLCIVPDRGGAAVKAGEKVFLPFEGDSTLSIILSKAFLLAEDANIKDPTILKQIRGS